MGILKLRTTYRQQLAELTLTQERLCENRLLQTSKKPWTSHPRWPHAFTVSTTSENLHLVLNLVFRYALLHHPHPDIHHCNTNDCTIEAQKASYSQDWRQIRVGFV